jgi:hypothetical protein
MKPLTKTVLLGFIWVVILTIPAYSLVLAAWQFSFLLSAIPGLIIWFVINIKTPTEFHSIALSSISSLISVLIIMLPYIIYKTKNIQSNWLYAGSSIYSLINALLGLLIIASQHV